MSDEQSRGGRRPLDKITSEHIDDPDEIARLTANSPDDSGAAMMFFAVGDYFFDQKPGRSKVKAMLNMIEFLTPEQQVEFARKLPEMLSAEAKAMLAEPCRAEANGTA